MLGFKRHNGIIAYDASKDVENQIALVRNKFANNQLFICERCKMHIIEHQAYVWDESSKTIKPKKENDHSVNSTQYIFSTYNNYKSKDHESEKQYKKTLEYLTTRRENKNNGFV